MTHHIKRFIPVALLMLALLLAACGGGEVIEEGGNVIPTPIEGEDVGEEISSQAAGTPQETYDRYIVASIAGQVNAQKDKIDMRQRYQDPEITKQDLGGLVTEISILEDRTEVDQPTDNAATAQVDMDIRVQYADGDTESRTCSYTVSMQRSTNEDEEDVWYVVNPDAFPVFFSCNPS